jgi:hypothetical protein
MSISVDQVMPMLVDACPSFRKLYDGLNEVHKPASPEILMDDFADHVFGLLEDGKTKEFPSIFLVIEEVKLNGDDKAKSLIRDCFFGEIDSIMDKKKKSNVRTQIE